VDETSESTETITCYEGLDLFPLRGNGELGPEAAWAATGFHVSGFMVP
jgi:hypothetical protein